MCDRVIGGNNPLIVVNPWGLFDMQSSTRDFVDRIGGEQMLENGRNGSLIVMYATSESVVGGLVFGGMAAGFEGLRISLYSENQVRDTIQTGVGMATGTNTPADMVFSEAINQINNYNTQGVSSGSSCNN